MTAASPVIEPPARARARGGGLPAPVVPGRLPLLGHLLALRRDPVAFLTTVRSRCGDVGAFDLAGHRITLLSGAAAQEAFFRAPDEQLDQAAAYPFMKPIFGPGVVFDASPEQRRQAMRNQSLRDKMMRGHAETIGTEVERITASWGEAGEIDLLDFFSELTIYTSSAALVGREFREELGPDYVALFKDLERGTDAFAYVNPHLPLPAFWRRDRARRELATRITAIFQVREAEGRECRDLFQVLHNAHGPDGCRRYGDDQITGMFVSMMFAGHHTTSVVASWALLDLLRHPEWLGRVQAELDGLYADGRSVSYQALREIPVLESCLMETLRLHPPLVLLMRKAMSDFEHGGFRVPAGETVAVSPAVSNRLPEHFPEPERYDPTRYAPGREEDRQVFAWIPFGAGRHRCVGAAFAMMQLKAIFSLLLTRFDFALGQPAERYGIDTSKMVVALRQPCPVGYRRRVDVPVPGASIRAGTDPGATEPAAAALHLGADLDLCQGHGVCVAEAPEVFALDESTGKVRILDEQPGEEHLPAVEAALRHCPTRAIRNVAPRAKD